MINLLLEFEGILGALLGVTLTLILTHLLKNSGKVNIEILNVDFTFYNLDGWGESTLSSNDTAEFMNLRFIVNLYNASDIPKPINDIPLELLDGNNRIINKVYLKDESTKRFASASYIHDELHYLNIMPKHLERKELFFSTYLKDNAIYRSVKKARLVYRNENKKTKRINIF